MRTNTGSKTSNEEPAPENRSGGCVRKCSHRCDQSTQVKHIRKKTGQSRENNGRTQQRRGRDIK